MINYLTSSYKVTNAIVGALTSWPYLILIIFQIPYSKYYLHMNYLIKILTHGTFKPQQRC